MTGAAVVVAIVGLLSALALSGFFTSRFDKAPVVSNFRGRRVPVVGGMVIVSCLLITQAAVALRRDDLLLSRSNAGVVLLCAGFFILGLLDDLSSSAGAKGLRGHFLELRRGRVTSGIVKAAGGLAVAVTVSAIWNDDIAVVALDGLIIAASANLLNLLDLRPGRAVKAYLLVWLPVALTAGPSQFFAVSAGLTGAAAGWLPWDLSEKGILGDAGSNLLGAIAGATVALTLSNWPKGGVLVLLVGLTLASEKYSFTRVIARTPPLRWLDSLGTGRGGETPESFPDRPG